MMTTSSYSKRISAAAPFQDWVVHLSPRQMLGYRALLEGTYTVSGLAEKLGITCPAASSIARELLTKGVVNVAPGPSGGHNIRWYAGDPTITCRAG